MSERIHVLAQQLFGKPSVAECDLGEIRRLTERYPYFAPAQFLLLEKLKQDNSADYHSQLQKAVLYYHNPLEFEYFISSDRFYTEESTRFTAHTVQDEVPVDEPVNEEEASRHKLHAERVEISTATEEKPVFDGQEVELDRNASYASEEVNFIANESGVHEKEKTEGAQSPDTDTNAAIGELDQIEIGDFHSEIVEEPEDLETHKLLFEEPESGESETDQNIEPEISVKLRTELSSYTIPKPPLPESQLETPGEPLAFEPYHTVDYFASQGIKLSQEEIPKDKFGKQLKSFTEWLKTMKRLPVTEIAQSTNPSLESNVQHLAEDSVHESDIVTEAMAEVWLKQGNKQKALETYNKLGLLNPSKRAYFAALIENVKRS